jgi:hypothetical protein
VKKSCSKGKSCGATCIDPRERCILELGPELSKSLTKVRSGMGSGEGELRPAPPDLLAEIKALGPPPWATPEASKEEVVDDIADLLFGTYPTPRAMPVDSGTAATGNTRWARQDAEDFDGALGQVRRDGSKSYDGWSDSYKSGSSKIGEGSYGTVVKNPDGTYVKRGAVSESEGKLIDRLGKADLGPRLIAADINGKHDYSSEKFVDIKNGRIAMTKVEGSPMGQAKADTVIGGKKAADIYWKAMADLHRLGIAHNDAHIDNIMVDGNGKGRWVDLGLAQLSPKAALAEAMGVFKDRPGGDAITIPSGGGGEGNWQTRRWLAANVENLNNAKRVGGSAWKEYQQRFPIAAKVWDNQEKVIAKMEKMGMDVNEINSVINHGIRSTMGSYDKSDGFGRMTDAQAQDLLKTLYDGI